MPLTTWFTPKWSVLERRDTLATGLLHPIPGFKQLKAWKHGRFWYIIDCADETTGDPYKNSIGGYFETSGCAKKFAEENYTGQYK
jgi:hypothetical protein